MAYQACPSCLCCVCLFQRTRCIATQTWSTAYHSMQSALTPYDTVPVGVHPKTLSCLCQFRMCQSSVSDNKQGVVQGNHRAMTFHISKTHANLGTPQLYKQYGLQTYIWACMLFPTAMCACDFVHKLGMWAC